MNNKVLFIEILLVHGPPPLETFRVGGLSYYRFETSWRWRMEVRWWMEKVKGIASAQKRGAALDAFFTWWRDTHGQ